jgi:endonuclease/exonuclease/phosphatase (EEP) superfamily protein YafD
MKNLSTVIGTCAFLLIAALAGRYVSGHWVFATFASFQIQAAAFAAVIAAVAWLLHRNAVASLLVIAAVAIGVHGYIMLGAFRQPQPMPPPSWPADIKIVSFNLMGDNSFDNGGRFADYMIASGADVVFVQESAPLGPHIDRIKAVYPYRLGCGAQTITCDQSLWSRRPLIDGQVKTASPLFRDRLMFASIDIGGGKLVRFANVHFAKPYFDNVEAIELKRVREILGTGKEPLVLGGDFNASVLTSDIRKFLGDMELLTAQSEPSTWPVNAGAGGMAIDHLFVRDPLRFKSLERLPETFGSNHHGLVAEIWWQDLTITYPLE